MCTSIWKEGMRRREPDSSQYHPVLGQKAWGQLNTLFFFFNTATVVTDCGVSIRGDARNQTGQSPGQPGLAGHA